MASNAYSVRYKRLMKTKRKLATGHAEPKNLIWNSYALFFSLFEFFVIFGNAIYGIFETIIM